MQYNSLFRRDLRSATSNSIKSSFSPGSESIAMSHADSCCHSCSIANATSILRKEGSLRSAGRESDKWGSHTLLLWCRTLVTHPGSGLSPQSVEDLERWSARSLSECASPCCASGTPKVCRSCLRDLEVTCRAASLKKYGSAAKAKGALRRLRHCIALHRKTALKRSSVCVFCPNGTTASSRMSVPFMIKRIACITSSSTRSFFCRKAASTSGKNVTPQVVQKLMTAIMDDNGPRGNVLPVLCSLHSNRLRHSINAVTDGGERRECAFPSCPTKEGGTCAWVRPLRQPEDESDQIL